MSTIRIRDPFAEFDRMLATAFAHRPHQPQRNRATTPDSDRQVPVNVFETEDGIGIEAWLPGFAENELSVTVDDGQLRIHAERTADNESEAGSGADRKYRRREVARTVLSRSFRLDPAYDAEQISARLANGVLELSLPKAAQPEPQQIAINTNS